MGRFFPRQVSVLLLTSALAAPALADPPPIGPFSNSYSFSGSGVPFSITAERTLRQVGNSNTWEMQIRARNMLGEIRETTRFRWQQCLPLSEHYGYYRRGLGRVREATLTLDRGAGNAVLRRGGEVSREFEITRDTTDILSQTLGLQCRLQNGFTEGRITLNVASERRLEPMTYEITGEERLRTPAGRFQTIRLERVRDDDSGRRTLLWFAPELGYTLVKMIQDDGDDAYELVLRNH